MQQTTKPILINAISFLTIH